MSEHALKNECPWCFYSSDSVTGVSEKSEPPEPGDLSVCAECGEAAVYGERLELNRMTEDQREALTPDTQRILATARREIKRLHRQPDLLSKGGRS